MLHRDLERDSATEVNKSLHVDAELLTITSLAPSHAVGIERRVGGCRHIVGNTCGGKEILGKTALSRYSVRRQCGHCRGPLISHAKIRIVKFDVLFDSRGQSCYRIEHLATIRIVFSIPHVDVTRRFEAVDLINFVPVIVYVHLMVTRLCVVAYNEERVFSRERTVGSGVALALLATIYEFLVAEASSPMCVKVGNKQLQPRNKIQQESFVVRSLYCGEL